MFCLQINALQNEYKKQEEELLKCRRSSQEEMLVFMEEEVGTKLSNLSNLRVRIEARLRHNHQVCKVLLLYQLPCCGAVEPRNYYMYYPGSRDLVQYNLVAGNR